MPNFTLTEQVHYNTRQKVFKLSRDGRCYLDEFIEAVKADNNLKHELGDLIPTIKYVANNNEPKPPARRYKKLRVSKNCKYPVFEAKSDELRLYVFIDEEGMIIILGGKKKKQDRDIERIESILKEYYEFQTHKQK